MRLGNCSFTLLCAALLISGCSASRLRQSTENEFVSPGDSGPPHEYDYSSQPSSRAVPPPPAPPALGVSRVKRVGFLRELGSRLRGSFGHQPSATCGDDNCAERRDACRSDSGYCNCGSETSCGCCSNDGCGDSCRDDRTRGDDRHPCLADCLGDPFLEEDPLTAPDLEAVSPTAPQPALPQLPVLPQPQLRTMSQAESRQQGASVPLPLQRTIIEPPNWPSRRSVTSAISPGRVIEHMLIQPRH